jgi:hypothetical protein
MEEVEQRLTMRVLGIWRSLCRGSQPPRRSQIDPILFGADWPNCMLIDLDPTLDHSRLSYVGNALRDPSWPPFDRQTISACEEGTLLRAIVAYAPRVLAMRSPISTGGVVTYEEEPVLYRSIVLPLGEADNRIDGLLAAASYRAIAMTEEVHSFHEQGVGGSPLVELVEA